MDVANLILESYQKFGFITAETIDSVRNAQRLKVIQVMQQPCPQGLFVDKNGDPGNEVGKAKQPS